MPRSFAVNNKSFPMTAEAVVSLALVLLMALAMSTRLQAQGPALTTISGTVYRADGTAALGTVLISWPSFQTAEEDAVAASLQSVTKLKGRVQLVAPGTLPNDGKIIADERSIG